MRILITGGAGFLGSRLCRSLLQRGELCGAPLQEIVVADLARPVPEITAEPRVRCIVGPLLDYCPAIAEGHFDAVFHLAGAVSAECEANFDLGMRSNLDTTRALLEALRFSGNTPRFFFASSVAVFGAEAGNVLPRVILDDTLPVPQSSYGVQKFISEQLVAEYTRKGFIDGRSGRLMTVVIRPNPPNRAASGFLSSILREPLSGLEAVCPVPASMAVAIASPANAIQAIIRLMEADREAVGGRTAVNFPALTVTVGEMLDALEAASGTGARSRVKFHEDEAITRIVGSWPSTFRNDRATKLGLRADRDMRSIIDQFISEYGSSRVEA